MVNFLSWHFKLNIPTHIFDFGNVIIISILTNERKSNA